jgi:NAD(P)-dependent dehydrogenase (short-subunit alcohol dehydrogenase family)
MLARRGAEVILACRSTANAERAAETMRAEYPSENLHLTVVAPLDLSDLDSVAAFAREVRKKYSRLDILVNNAGVMVPPLTRTRQGFELQFGVNHLGHFALTGRLLPIINGRVVSLSSVAAWWGGLDLDDPNYERRRYNRWRAYGASKLADQMFIQELATAAANWATQINEGHEKSAAVRQVIALAAHPGISATNLFKNSAAGKWYACNFSQSPERGALPVVRAATDPTATNGSYWGPGGCFEISGAPAPARIPSAALDPVRRAKLWALSEELTGVKY